MHRHLLHINGVKNTVCVPDLWEPIASENRHCTLKCECNRGKNAVAGNMTNENKQQIKLKSKPKTKPHQRSENERRKKKRERIKIKWGKLFKLLLNNKCTHTGLTNYVWIAKRERVLWSKFICQKLVSAADESENCCSCISVLIKKKKTYSCLVLGCRECSRQSAIGNSVGWHHNTSIC